MHNCIEISNLKLYLDNNVYAPKEDSFLFIDSLEKFDLPILEIGSGSGIILLSLGNLEDINIAVDINMSAAYLTMFNSRVNNFDTSVICGDGISAFRNNSLPGTVLFNPPYLPMDPEIDKYLSTSELQQFVGGEYGYEELNHIISQLNKNKSLITFYCMISSLSTTPNKFAKLHQNWDIMQISSKQLDFETLWILKMTKKH